MQTDPPAPEVSQLVVLGSDGQPTGQTESEDHPSNLVDQVPAPAKVMRIGSMIKQLLEEVRTAPLDDASRQRLSEIHMRSIKELEDGLAPELVEELERLALPFDSGSIPSDAELRIAQAQLVGWLEGLFHGIQTALFAQQMMAQSQVEQLRQRAIGGGDGGGPSGQGPDDSGRSAGLYL
jgi:hypothetical protein